MNKSVCVLLTFTVFSLVALSSSIVSADDVVDEISISVPVACTLSGTGQISHNATINNGQYDSAVGETTLRALCNDNEGFAIYTIGYTDDTDGTNVLSNASLGSTYDIETGTLTSGADSQWAMKLSTVTSPEPTYPITIQNSFNSFQEVPDDYTLVASRASGTDTGQLAEGSILKTTYQVYISPTQPAGSYTGQVKYTLVHPSVAPPPVSENQIGVIYDGNGLFFDQAKTQSTNRVVYENRCEEEYGYIADTPTVLKTRNLSADGTQNGPYSEDGGTYYEGDGLDPNHASFEGASKLKIVMRYGLSAEGGYFGFAIDTVSLEDEFPGIFDSAGFYIDRAGTVTRVFGGSEISIYADYGGWDVNTGYDYGLYVQVYPVYDEPTEGTTYGLVQNACSYRPVIGTYAETVPWNGYWYTDKGDYPVYFYYEEKDAYNNYSNGVIKYLDQNSEELAGSTITLYAYAPFTVIYNGNGATAGKMLRSTQQFSEEPDPNYGINLVAPNFAKNGYGFAGWSTNQNATVNSSDTIFGPNEHITGDDVSFDNERNKNLYAIWVAPENGVTMQTFNGSASPYASYSIGTVIALGDERDGNVYAIAKLADGNWWMIENLRLNPATAVDGNHTSTINTSTTNAPTSTFLNTELAGILDGTNTTYWRTCTTNSASCSSHISFGTGNITNINNPNSFSYIENGRSVPWYSYGVMYNWYTATAGNGLYPNTNSPIDGDICPDGWRLPGYFGAYSFDNLIFDYLGATGNNAESSDKVREYPNNFILSGLYRGTSASNRGSAGNYWEGYGGMSSGTASFLRFGTNSLQTSQKNSLFAPQLNGLAVRCLANPSN